MNMLAAHSAIKCDALQFVRKYFIIAPGNTYCIVREIRIIYKPYGCMNAQPANRQYLLLVIGRKYMQPVHYQYEIGTEGSGHRQRRFWSSHDTLCRQLF
ncbi:hypothetical protein D3C77_636730 [compost metagenome]